MSTKQHLDERYADLFPEDRDPALINVIQGLDAITESIQAPSSLPPAFDDVLALRQAKASASRQWGQDLIDFLRGLRRPVAIPAVIVLVLLLAGAAYRVIPIVDRAFYSDAGSQQILNSALATQLNLTETHGGYTVTLQRVYADVNRVVVGYTIRGPDGRAFQDFNRLGRMRSTISDASGTAFDELGGAYVEGGAVLDNFDASQVQGNPADLSLQLTVPLLQALNQDDQTGGGNGPPFVFRFTVPFRQGRVAAPEQTVTAGGRAVTLERVVVTPSETRVYLQGLNGTGIFPHLTVDGYDSDHVTLVGWKPTEAGEVLRLVHETSGGLIACDFLQPLTDKHGAWTLTIKAGPATADGRQVTGGPWTFHFEVP